MMFRYEGVRLGEEGSFVHFIAQFYRKALNQTAR